MIALIFQTIYIAVYNAAKSFYYAVPTLLVFDVLAAAYFHVYESMPPIPLALGAFCIILFFGILYVFVSMRLMLDPHAPPLFMETLLWKRAHSDFLVFIGIFFLLLGVLIMIMADRAQVLSEFTQNLIYQRANAKIEEEHSVHQTGIIVVLFSSRVFVGFFIIGMVALWIYAYRACIRIPAYADGWQLSTHEAMDLTKTKILEIIFCSLFINNGLLVFASVVLLWDIDELWLKAVTVGGVFWLFLHANMALSVAMYKRYTEGYQMRRERYF
jgi:hypothetical protein